MWGIVEGCINVNRFKVNYERSVKDEYNMFCYLWVKAMTWEYFLCNELAKRNLSLLKETWMLICIGSIKTYSCLSSILDGFTSLNPCSQSWAAQNQLVNCDYVPATGQSGEGAETPTAPWAGAGPVTPSFAFAHTALLLSLPGRQPHFCNSPSSRLLVFLASTTTSRQDITISVSLTHLHYPYSNVN